MRKLDPGRLKTDRRYRPPFPEAPSAFSRWALRCELALTVVLAISVLLYIKRSEVDDGMAFTGAALKSPIAHVAIGAGDAPQDEPSAGGEADALKGHALFMQSCTSCHGQNAQGLPRMGVNLRQSKFIATSSDLKLIAFLKGGRRPTDPNNTTGVPMPPRGGNLALDDDALADIVAFLRQVQKQ